MPDRVERGTRRWVAVPALALAATLSAACHPAAAPAPAPAPAPATPPAPAPAPRVDYVVSPLTAGLDLPFSEAVRVGDMLYLSGMVGIRPGMMELVPGGLEPETRQTLDNIRTILEAAGASLDDVVRCLVMLDDISQWSRFNAIYVEYFGARRPARSALGADGLALGAAVEVECIAVVPSR